jgi:hypothetical protein
VGALSRPCPSASLGPDIEAAVESSVNDAVRVAKAAENLLVNDDHTEFLDLVHLD